MDGWELIANKENRCHNKPDTECIFIANKLGTVNKEG